MPSLGGTASAMVGMAGGGTVVGTAIVNLTTNNAGLAKGFAAADKGLQGFAGKMQQAGRTMVSIGGALTRGLTLPIAAVSAVSLKMASDFETAMKKTVALGGVTQKQFAGMREEVLKLSQETGRAPLEVADALYFISSAGLKANQVMPVLTASAQAAEAQFADTATVGNLLVTILNGYGKEALSASANMDVLTAAIKLGKAEPADMVATLGNVIPVAAQLGISFDQVGAALAVSTNKGVEASRAITGLRYLMTHLLNPTEEAKGIYKDFGLSIAEVQRNLADPGIGLLGTLRMLADTFNINSVKGKEAFDTILGGVRASIVALPLVTGNAAQTTDVFNKLGMAADGVGISFETAVKKMEQTPEVKMQIAFNELRLAAIDFGSTLLPALVEAVQWVGQLAHAFAALPVSTQAWIAKLLMVAAVIGPILKLLGNVALAGSAISRGFSALTGGTTAGAASTAAAALVGGGEGAGAAMVAGATEAAAILSTGGAKAAGVGLVDDVAGAVSPYPINTYQSRAAAAAATASGVSPYPINTYAARAEAARKLALAEQEVAAATTTAASASKSSFPTFVKGADMMKSAASGFKSFMAPLFSLKGLAVAAGTVFGLAKSWEYFQGVMNGRPEEIEKLTQSMIEGSGAAVDYSKAVGNIKEIGPAGVPLSAGDSDAVTSLQIAKEIPGALKETLWDSDAARLFWGITTMGGSELLRAMTTYNAEARTAGELAAANEKYIVGQYNATNMMSATLSKMFGVQQPQNPFAISAGLTDQNQTPAPNSIGSEINFLSTLRAPAGSSEEQTEAFKQQTLSIGQLEAAYAHMQGSMKGVNMEQLHMLINANKLDQATELLNESLTRVSGTYDKQLQRMLGSKKNYAAYGEAIRENTALSLKESKAVAQGAKAAGNLSKHQEGVVNGMIATADSAEDVTAIIDKLEQFSGKTIKIGVAVETKGGKSKLPDWLTGGGKGAVKMPKWVAPKIPPPNTSAFTNGVKAAVNQAVGMINKAKGTVQVDADMSPFQAAVQGVIGSVIGTAMIAVQATVGGGVGGGGGAGGSGNAGGKGPHHEGGVIMHGGGGVGRRLLSDEVPGILQQGEFLVRRKSAARNMSLLHAINQGRQPRMQQQDRGGTHFDNRRQIQLGDVHIHGFTGDSRDARRLASEVSREISKQMGRATMAPVL